VKGAVDDLDLILKTLERVGYTEDRFYIHVDGALFGLMMPFVKKVSILGISLDITANNLEQIEVAHQCHEELLLLIQGRVDYSASNCNRQYAYCNRLNLCRYKKP